jgi:hypothetical protein
MHVGTRSTTLQLPASTVYDIVAYDAMRLQPLTNYFAIAAIDKEPEKAGH